MGNTVSSDEQVSISKEDYIKYKQLEKKQQDILQEKYKLHKKQNVSKKSIEIAEISINHNKINQKNDFNQKLNNYVMNENNIYQNDVQFSFPQSQMYTKDKGEDFKIKMDILESQRSHDETNKFNDTTKLMNDITINDIDPYKITTCI